MKDSIVDGSITGQHLGNEVMVIPVTKIKNGEVIFEDLVVTEEQCTKEFLENCIQETKASIMYLDEKRKVLEKLKEDNDKTYNNIQDKTNNVFGNLENKIKEIFDDLKINLRRR